MIPTQGKTQNLFKIDFVWSGIEAKLIAKNLELEMPVQYIKKILNAGITKKELGNGKEAGLAEIYELIETKDKSLFAHFCTH